MLSDGLSHLYFVGFSFFLFFLQKEDKQINCFSVLYLKLYVLVEH